MISATLLVLTTETCILWYASLGSQHVILLPNHSKSVERRKVVSIFRDFISFIRKSVW